MRADEGEEADLLGSDIVMIFDECPPVNVDGKPVDKAAVITDVRVETKTGGKSGDWSREGRS